MHSFVHSFKIAATSRESSVSPASSELKRRTQHCKCHGSNVLACVSWDNLHHSRLPITMWTHPWIIKWRWKSFLPAFNKNNELQMSKNCGSWLATFCGSWIAATAWRTYGNVVMFRWIARRHDSRKLHITICMIITSSLYRVYRIYNIRSKTCIWEAGQTSPHI